MRIVRPASRPYDLRFMRWIVGGLVVVLTALNAPSTAQAANRCADRAGEGDRRDGLRAGPGCGGDPDRTECRSACVGRHSSAPLADLDAFLIAIVANDTPQDGAITDV